MPVAPLKNCKSIYFTQVSNVIMYIKSSEYQVIGSPSKIEGELTHSCLTILIVAIETYRS